MTLRGAVSLWLVLLLTGCSASRVVRLEVGQGRPLEYVPPTSDRSVPVDEDAFEEALARLVLEVPLSIRASQVGGLVRTSAADGFATADRAWQLALRKDYGRWCRAYEAPGDCLSLLEDGLGFTSMDRLAMALGLSMDPMHESLAEALRDTFSPTLFKAVVVSALVSWAVLAANPEPVFTKAAAVLSVVMLAYLGIDSFLEVVRACWELKQASDRATTFQELNGAGERFGSVMGKEGARVFVLATTMLLSRGTVGSATWLATRLPQLPRFTEAASLAASQLGLRLEAAGAVTSVAVVEGQLVIALAPNAVAMAAMGSGGGHPGVKVLPSGGPGEWVQASESMPESARAYQEKVTGAPRGWVYRVKVNGDEVDFDGFDPKEGVLLEAKGPNLAKFFDGELDAKWFFRGADKFVLQARRQLQAASKMRVRWVIAEKKFADTLLKLFRQNGVKGVEISHVPP
ncbi:restriction endonuclease fold toxin 5 domain-containing protein [Pyxidicoccus parkwayensis]|uniref:Restriction endonuclease fold toxin 5 domain-containing protein n=1 Tax=Pyxidicoccus parkwayensis TaxID=2813578 RepID=A0ABX7NWJ1_9BACT|nr:restriction endonuclease fold toxin 5 domain-containing protein [Pyxidicoccus parkwaysis]QSQ23321.1 restriction endonuclease fold toxin 5 domain-containing protein [Pyxidicoccus parkwaysis]